MALSATVVNVGDTETSLLTGASGDEVLIKPLHNQKIYIGPTGVTVATGYPVQGEFRYAPASATELFGIVETDKVIPTAVFVSDAA
jgi:hypothetical protein